MTEVIEKVSFGKKVREKLIFRFIQRHQREFVRSTSMITLYPQLSPPYDRVYYMSQHFLLGLL